MKHELTQSPSLLPLSAEQGVGIRERMCLERRMEETLCVWSRAEAGRRSLTTVAGNPPSLSGRMAEDAMR